MNEGIVKLFDLCYAGSQAKSLLTLKVYGKMLQDLLMKGTVWDKERTILILPSLLLVSL